MGREMSEQALTKLQVASLRDSPSRLPIFIFATAAIFFGVVMVRAAEAPATEASVLEQPSAIEAIGYVGGSQVTAQVTTVNAPAHDDAKRFTGRVGSDLSAAMLAAGVPERQAREYVSVLARAVRLAGELSVDDRFDLVIERRDDGTLGLLVYAGLDRIARADVALMKWTNGREIIWVNGDGVGGSGEQSLGRPVDGRLTSPFGSRFHPVLGHRRMHRGVDLAAPQGAPIVAAADGRVTAAGWNGGYGRQIALAHAGGMRTTYGHLSRIAASTGSYVRRGQVIGYVGSSGLSTGPHLHFEVSKDGSVVNPLTAKLAGGPGHLEGDQLRAFQDQLRRVLLSPSHS